MSCHDLRTSHDRGGFHELVTSNTLDGNLSNNTQGTYTHLHKGEDFQGVFDV